MNKLIYVGILATSNPTKIQSIMVYIKEADILVMVMVMMICTKYNDDDVGGDDDDDDSFDDDDVIT